jgi:hypothetical protein
MRFRDNLKIESIETTIVEILIKKIDFYIIDIRILFLINIKNID